MQAVLCFPVTMGHLKGPLMAVGTVSLALLVLIHAAYADQYVGCYRDGPGPRAIPTLVMVSSTSMTVEKCAKLAANRGQAVYGIEYASECYAGEEMTTGPADYIGNAHHHSHAVSMHCLM